MILKTNRIACVLLPASLLLSVITSLQGAEFIDRIDKQFTADPGGKLLMEVDRGSIDVKAKDGGAVEVHVIRTVGESEERAKKLLQDHEVTLTQDGNLVSVRARWLGKPNYRWLNFWRNFQVKYEVVVPAKFDVDLKTAGGAIAVNDLTGNLQAQTSGGSLTFGGITGPLHGRTSGGSITAARCRGDVELQTSGGSLNLENIDGKVVASTAGGSIKVHGVTGAATVKTSGGSINVTDVPGPVEAITSGGAISASLPRQPAGDCSFKTSGGTVSVTMPAEVALDVDARCSGGRVSTELPVVSVIQGEKNDRQLVGKINGGGPKLIAHTSGGSVQLRKR